jgi:hypothetical protein
MLPALAVRAWRWRHADRALGRRYALTWRAMLDQIEAA